MQFSVPSDGRMAGLVNARAFFLPLFAIGHEQLALPSSPHLEERPLHLTGWDLLAIQTRCYLGRSGNN